MSGQAGYFLVIGVVGSALAVLLVATMAAGYYGDLESRLRYERRRLAAIESGSVVEAGIASREVEAYGAAEPGEDGALDDGVAEDRAPSER